MAYNEELIENLQAWINELEDFIMRLIDEGWDLSYDTFPPDMDVIADKVIFNVKGRATE